jgi:hypothetical protein
VLHGKATSVTVSGVRPLEQATADVCTEKGLPQLNDGKLPFIEEL